MNLTGASKTGHANIPSRRGSAEIALHRRCIARFQKIRETGICRAFAEETLRGTLEQPLAGAIDELDPRLGIEREDRGVDFADDRANKSGGLDRGEPPPAHGDAQLIQLEENLAEASRLGCLARTDRVVLLAH